MGKTRVATGDTGIAKKVYDEKVFRDTKKATFFGSMMGEGPDSLIQVKTDLNGERGDTIYFNLRMRLSGSGVTSGQILEGNEERLTAYNDSVVLERYRHAVRDDGEMTRQRAAYDVDAESELALKDWGSEKIDQLIFDALLTTATKVFYLNSSGVVSAGSAATAKAGLHATNSKLTLDFITAVSTWAMTGGNRSYVPIRPVKVDGRSYVVVLVHPDNLYDLEVSSDWKNACNYAKERGDDNPLFKGAIAITWNGAIIKPHENVPIATDGGGSTVAWSKCVLMGAQAGVWAWGKRPKLIKDTFDYEEEHGMAWGITAKCKKPQFNSLDYGSVGIYAARTNISGL